MDEIESKNQKPIKFAIHLFAGVARSQCVSKMYVRNVTKYVCPECKNKILVDDLENMFYEELKAYLNSESEIASTIGNIQKGINEKSC